MVTLGSQSLQEGSVEAGYTFTGNVVDLRRRAPEVLAAAAALDRLRRDRHGRARSCSAYPLAYYIAQKAGRWKNLMLVLVIAPFFTSFLIRTLAWRTILSDTGPVTEHRAGAAHHRPAPGRAA